MESYGIEIDVGHRTEISRVPLGLFSFDFALGSKSGKIGIPLRTMIEIAGKNHVGKSTFSYYMSGVLASLDTNDGEIEICDLEGLDVDYLRQAIGVSGFKGKVHLIDSIEKGRIRQHPTMLQESVDNLYKKEKTRVALLDSVGAFISNAESEGDIGEAFMGKRAFNLAQYARRSVTHLNNKATPANVIFINHTHTVLSGHGNLTAGGDTLKYLAAVRLGLWQQEIVKVKISEKEDRILGYRVGGQVDKLRYGGKGKKFSLVIVPEYGVSKELTALYDAADLGLIDRGSVVKVDGKSLGYISKLFEIAVDGNKTKFDPIFEKLEKYKEEHVLGNTGIYEGDDDTTQDTTG